MTTLLICHKWYETPMLLLKEKIKKQRSECPEDTHKKDELQKVLKSKLKIIKLNMYWRTKSLKPNEGPGNPLAIAQEYIDNVEEFINTLDDLKPKLLHRRIKATFTQTINKHHKQLQQHT